MGLISLFIKKKGTPSSTDRVWKTRSACLKGLAADAGNALAAGQTPVVFSFFPGDLERFITYLTTLQGSFFMLESGKIAEASGHTHSIFVADTNLISQPLLDFLAQRLKTGGLSIFFLGHYPLPEPENAVLQKLTSLLGPVAFIFCLSLDDGLLAQFGADRIRKVLDNLNLGEDECVEHALVSKAIAGAREKLAGKVVAESRTRTERDWFTRNVPGY